MKPNQFGLQGVLFFTLMLGFHCLPLQAQDEATVAFNNGMNAYMKGDFNGAIANYNQAIALNPKSAEAYNNRGVAEGKKGDFDSELADYNQAIVLNPKYEFAYSNRAKEKRRRGDLDGAIADCDQAIAFNPRREEAYNVRGVVKEQKGDFDGAIADDDEAIALNPKNAGAFNNRAMVKIDKNDFDGAISDCTQAIALNPRQAEAYNNSGFAKEKIRDFDGAISDCSQAIALDPNGAVAYDNRGYAKTEKTDFGGAIADFNQAIAINPQFADAYFNRGIAKDCKGDHEGANNDYNEAISLGRTQEGNSPSSPPSTPPSLPSGEGRRVALGTGFFVTSTGYLLTDFHVVKGASSIRVKIGNDFLSASLVAKDVVNDIVLLKIEGAYPCLSLGDSSTALLGQTVFTVGFPKSGLQGLSPKLTKGEISSLNGMEDDPRMFQVSVPIQPGNSGGCLADESGNVVGLVEATLSTVETANGTGDLLQNVNYATKINYARTLLDTVQDAKSGLLPIKTARAPFTDEVKSVEDATVFIIADSSDRSRPSTHVYKDSAGNAYSISDIDYQRLYPQKVALDAENKKLNQRDDELKAQARRIEQERQYLDNTNPQAVDSFNAGVNSHNSFKEEIQQETNAFNDAVEKFNAELRRVGTLIK